MNHFYINPEGVEEKVQDWGSLKILLESSKIGAVSGFSIGLITYNKSHYSGRHEDYEAIYILEGEGTASIGGKAIDFIKGSILVIPAGIEHSIAVVSDGPIEALLMHFT
jgi:quercetin dioxygenase-like cupin family protein